MRMSFSRVVDDTMSAVCSFLRNDVHLDSSLTRIPWNFVCEELLGTLRRLPAGITNSIASSEVIQSWNKKKWDWKLGINANFQSIDAIVEMKNPAQDFRLESIVISVEGTKAQSPESTLFLRLKENGGKNSVLMYLHRKFYDLALEKLGGNGIVNRIVRVAGCRSVRDREGELRILPSDLLLVVLDYRKSEDKQFLKDNFGNDVLSLMQMNPESVESSYKILLKIVKVDKPTTVWNGAHGSQLIIVKLTDTTVSVPVKLFLWDSQCEFASFFSEDDFLAIERPNIRGTSDISTPFVLEYGVNTVFYLIPMKRIQEVEIETSQRNSSHFHVPRTQDGLLDFSHCAERVCTSDLREGMIHVSMLLCIQRVDSLSDQIRMLLRDEFGSATLEMSRNNIREISDRELSIGHVIFLRNLRTRISDGRLILEVETVDPNSCTQVHNLRSILNSPGLFPVVSSLCRSRDEMTALKQLEEKSVDTLQIVVVECDVKSFMSENGSFSCGVTCGDRRHNVRVDDGFLKTMCGIPEDGRIDEDDFLLLLETLVNHSWIFLACTVGNESVLLNGRCKTI